MASNGGQRYGAWLAWIALLLTGLGTSYKLYGDLRVLQAAVSELDQDIGALEQRVDQLEQIARLPRPRP